MITVITRTANRSRYFAECRRSVLAQTLRPYHLIVSDTPEDEYPDGDRVVRVQHLDDRGHNQYFNIARLHVPASHPWVIFLDDDDAFSTPDAVATIAAAIRSANDMVLWQVDFHNRIIPGGMIYLSPQVGKISGIGFCYHVSNWVDWKPYACGDFLVIDELYQILRPVWIDQILTKIQREPGHGKRMDSIEKYGYQI